MVPGCVTLSDSYKSKWISASNNQTFISVDESLVSDDLLNKTVVFGHTDCIGTFYMHIHVHVIITYMYMYLL